MGHRGTTIFTAVLLLPTLSACIPNPERPQPGYDPRPAPPRNDQRPYEPRGGYPAPTPYYQPAPEARALPSQTPYPPTRAPRRRKAEQIDRNVTALPAPPPAWQTRTVTPDARMVSAGRYTVRAGDTLSAAAERTGAGAEAIARANGLSPPFLLRAGQRLEIPAGRYHQVRAGQTGIAIARAYGVDWSRVVTANDLREPYILRVGMRVLIPGGTTGTSSAAERAAAFQLDIDDLLTGSEPALAANERPVRPSASPRRVLSPLQAIAEPTRLVGGFAWPVHGRIVAHFGPGASGEKYNGVKIAVPLGTPILAAADGVVAYAGSGIPTLGGLVIIRHGDSWTTVYGHASQLLVQRGQAVRRGQTIALSGDSGLADRPEVHFEMRKGRTPVDPQRQLPGI